MIHLMLNMLKHLIYFLFIISTLVLFLITCNASEKIEKKIQLHDGESVVVRSSPAFSVILASENGIETILVLQHGRPAFTLRHENGIVIFTQNLYFDRKEEIITFEGMPLLPVSRITIASDKSGFIEQFKGGEWIKK